MWSPSTTILRLNKCCLQFKKRESLENLEELTSLKNQVEGLRLQDKLNKQKLHKDIKNLKERLSYTIKNTSQDIKKL